MVSQCSAQQVGSGAIVFREVMLQHLMVVPRWLMWVWHPKPLVINTTRAAHTGIAPRKTPVGVCSWQLAVPSHLTKTSAVSGRAATDKRSRIRGTCQAWSRTCQNKLTSTTLRQELCVVHPERLADSHKQYMVGFPQVTPSQD